jgi:hypothetical protein
MSESESEQPNADLEQTLASADYSQPTSAFEDQDNPFFGNQVFPPFPRCLMNPDESGHSDIYPLSQRGKTWIRKRLGDDSLEELAPILSTQVPYYGHAEDKLESSPPRKTFYPLPSTAEIRVMFENFLENFNAFCPLFDRTSLLSLCDENISDTPDEPDRWACTNVVLALEYTTRVKNTSTAPVDHRPGWQFILLMTYALVPRRFGQRRPF